MTVQYIMSTGKVYGRVKIDSNFIPLCLKTQFTRPLFALSMASWKIVTTVSGMLETSASWTDKKDVIPFFFSDEED